MDEKRPFAPCDPSANLLKLEHMSDKWIRASDIGEYLYCRRAWWLRRVQHVPSRNIQALNRGTQFHQQHGRLYTHALWAKRLAYLVLFIVLTLLAFQLFMGILPT
ncbi:MAG: hypothetical protein D6706_14155 [Chloroflexi bacterium]|nr:MAG: hypothetical protein D6706_14155 [Chloroflexota bacterium]